METYLLGPVFILLASIVTLTGSEGSGTRILTESQLFDRPVNSNVSFPCYVQNLDEGTVITWMKDERVISADNFKVLDDNRITVTHLVGRGANLTIRQLKTQDSGHYSCAVNLKEKPLKVVHKLQIQVPPQIHKMDPENGSITVRAGSRVKLECKASGQPKPTVYWNRLHNQAFPWGSGGNLTVAGEVLEMLDISRLYDGEYVCNADNGVGHKPVRQSINLKVLYPPEVSLENSWLHTGKGEIVTMACIVYSNPIAKVTWYKNTMKLLDGERIHTKSIGNTHKLSLSNVTEKDFGKYSCKASNMLEKDVTQTLEVTGAPSKPEIVSDTRSKDRYSYDLSWSVKSHYPIKIHEAQVWPVIHDGSVPIPPKTAQTKRIRMRKDNDPFTYNIKGLKNNTSYDIRIRSKNQHGWSPYSETFTFQTLDKEEMPMEVVKKPSDTNIYEGEGKFIEPLKSEPVTSRSSRNGIFIQTLLIVVNTCLFLSS